MLKRTRCVSPISVLNIIIGLYGLNSDLRQSIKEYDYAALVHNHILCCEAGNRRMPTN